jgi:hypothetical protein
MKTKQRGQTPKEYAMSKGKPLEQRIEDLERENFRLRAVNAIQNLMGRYTVNWVPKNVHRALDFYALDQPDVSVEIADRGVFIGPEAVKLFFAELSPMSQVVGNLLIHYLASPMIEIAGDGQTAKGVWRSPGIEAVVPPGGGKPVPMWSFGAYAVDFILTKGEWKIWHLHWFRVIKCTYKDGWVDDLSLTYTGRIPGSPENIGPTTFHNPYRPDTTQESIPPCPTPYETWTDSKWMVTERTLEDSV